MIDLRLSLYKTMYRIRAAELAICAHYGEDKMKTPMHMSMGSEAIAAGVCAALGPEAQVLGTYRSHALYIAKTGDTDCFFAEMYGKMGGTANGKSGSLHLTAPEHGLICTSGVVGANIPVALGAAWARKEPVAVFFGDGALNEGVFWESLNAACAMKLPVLFVLEDNGYAVNSASEERQGFQSVDRAVSAFDCELFQVAPDDCPTDAGAIYQLTRAALQAITERKRPAFLHLAYYRYLEHVGVKEDFEEGIRDRADFQAWLKNDPLWVMRDMISLDRFPIEWEVDAQIAESVRKAEAAPYPDADELHADVLA